jgi:NTP pyrophosphatase (non-canonical NTP hydrolase)
MSLFFETYEKSVMALRKPAANDTYAREGLVAEVGEYFNHRAKGIRDGFPENYKDLAKKELGDVLWFITAIANDEGFSLTEIAKANIAKLTDRKERGVLSGSGDNR